MPPWDHPPEAPSPDGAASVALVAVWLMAWSTSVYAVHSVPGVLVLVTTTAVLSAALWRGAARGTPSRAAIVACAVLGVASLALAPPFINVEEPTALLTIGTVLAAPALLLVAAVSWWPRRTATARSTTVRPTAATAIAVGAIATAALSMALVVLGSRPVIDVWVILQDTADGLLHGRNPYRMSFPGVPEGQTDHCFNYLPGTFVGTAPGRWLATDVRWALVAGILVPTVLLWWRARASATTDRATTTGTTTGADGAVTPRPAAVAPALALLVAVVPGTVLVAQQAWTEPLLLAALVGAAALLASGRANWAVLPLAFALATKQHLVVMLPILVFWPRFGVRRAAATGLGALALCAPWAIADWGRFRTCTVDFFLDQAPPPKSLSVWQLLPEPVRMPALLVGTAAVVALVLLRCPRTPGGFLIGAGTVLAGFSLLNKQTFVNQWWLVAGLVVAGLAMTARDGKPDVCESPSAEDGEHVGAQAAVASGHDDRDEGEGRDDARDAAHGARGDLHRGGRG